MGFPGYGQTLHTALLVFAGMQPVAFDDLYIDRAASAATPGEYRILPAFFQPETFRPATFQSATGEFRSFEFTYQLEGFEISLELKNRWQI